MKNYNNFMKHENGNLAVGFIKSRKAEHKVMDFCERYNTNIHEIIEQKKRANEKC